MINSLFNNPIYFIISLISLAVALTIHEFSHAAMSDHLGDPTARLSGRLSLNPLVHFDTFGLMFLLFFGFGWGKPVMFDPYNLKNPRKDAALISLAGPASNLILAVICSILLKLFILFKLPILATIGLVFFPSLIIINVSLGIFNLIPINPLDGFKIVGGILTEEKAREWYQLERYGIFFLILLFIPIGGSSMMDMFLRPVISFILNLLIPMSTGGGII